MCGESGGLRDVGMKELMDEGIEEGKQYSVISKR